MNFDDEVPPLPSHLMAQLQESPPPNPALEERLVQELGRIGLLPKPAPQAVWRWISYGIAASLIFGAGVAVGRRASATPETVVVTTPSERLEGAALRYLAALDAAPMGDSLVDLIAVASFRAAAQQVMARFPEQNVNLALSVSFTEGSLIPLGTAGRSEHTQWF